jgi:hypothetical protein
VVGYQLSWSEGWKYSSAGNPSGRVLQDFKPHWSEKVKMACRFKIHSARGLVVGYRPLYPHGSTWAAPDKVGPTRHKGPRGSPNCLVNRAEQAETTWWFRK